MKGIQKNKFLLLTALAVLATGCVSSSKYRTLEEKANMLEQETMRLNGEVAVFQGDMKERDGEIAELRNRVAETEEQKLQKEKEISQLKGTYENLVDDLKGEIEEGEIRVTQIRNKLTVNLVEKVLFNSGHSEVNPKGEEILNKVGTILKNVEDKEIRIEGYTDDVPIGGSLKKRFPTNWELSSQRATNVLRFLQEKTGVSGDRLSTVGYGEFRPLASNETLDGRAQNRRIEIVLVPKDLRKVPQEIE